MSKYFFINKILPLFFFVVFGAITYFIFIYGGLKHIDGSKVDWWEKWVSAIMVGAIGFFICKLIICINKGDWN